MFSQRFPAERSTMSAAVWECCPPVPAWHGNKSVFSSSEVDLSAKLMIMITVHEKSICRGEPEEKNPAVGGWVGGINLQVSCLFDQYYSTMMRLIRGELHWFCLNAEE